MYTYIIINMYVYIYMYLSCSFSSPSQKGQSGSLRTAPARAAMAPASSIQSSENKAKWQFAGSSEVEEQGSQQDASSQSPEDAVEVQEKSDELFWRTQLAEFF